MTCATSQTIHDHGDPDHPDPVSTGGQPNIFDEAGQATAEYALLTGAVALILALVAAWATSTGKVAALLDAVFDRLISAA
jgi:Flp pilus assembly pilin Flp